MKIIHLILAGIFLLISQGIQAQVKFKLSILPDQQTYLVSVLPEVSWSSPMNMVGSVQVVLRMETGEPFLAGEITSLVPETSWLDNAYLDHPSSSPEYNYVCFVLKERSTKNIPFENGVEVPLFTFKNLEPNCVGNLELVENDDLLTRRVIDLDHFNISQNMAVVGARGNAFSGVIGEGVNCEVISETQQPHLIVNDLRVFPIPAKDVLQIRWESNVDERIDQVRIFDQIGNLMKLEKLPANLSSEEQEFDLKVSDLPAGLYTGSLINLSGNYQFFKFIVLND
jgi:hypothetical protein